MTFLCGTFGKDRPDAGGGLCCIGAAMRGPESCTCWAAVYDMDQVAPVPAEPTVRVKPCEDCAYNTDSPEKRGDETVDGDAGQLDAIVRRGERFFCHQGIRRPLRFEHRPEDCAPGDRLIPHATVPGDEADYSPPIRSGVPYKADGSPADVCAGWAARRELVRADAGERS